MVNKPKCHKMSRVVAAAGLFVALLITACDSAPAVTSDADAKTKSSSGAASAPPVNTKTASPNKTGTLTAVTPNGPKRLEVKRAGAPGAPVVPVALVLRMVEVDLLASEVQSAPLVVEVWD